MTPYRTPQGEPPPEPELSFVLPRPPLWNAHALSFTILAVVAVAVAVAEGSLVLIWLPVATGLTWLRWGFLRETRLSVTPSGSGFRLRLEQRALWREPEITEFPMRQSARVELMPRSLGVNLGRMIGSLELWVDGKAVHLLEFVEDKEREQLVTDAAKTFNAELEKRTRKPPVAPAFMSKFLVALKADDAAIVSGLLKNGLSPHATHEQDTLAEHAAIRGAERSLAAVLDAGGTPSPRALALAAWAAPKNDRARFVQHLACAEMLLAAGVSPDAPAEDAGTAREAFEAAGVEFVALLARK